MTDNTSERAAMEAGYAHVEAMLPRADGESIGPFWYGWALREAFVAGAEWQARASAATQAVPEPVARNAQRYLWLRDNAYIELHPDCPRSDDWRPEHFDAKVDAALAAAPLPPVALPALTLTRRMLEELIALTERRTSDDGPGAAVLRFIESGPAGPGLYAYFTEYPEEGVTLIDGKSDVPPALTDSDFAILQSVHDEMDEGDGNAPGHCHEVLGIWDRDNGDLAGKPCGWCVTWAKFTELIERNRAILAASAAPAPEQMQPNAGAGTEQDHLIAPLAGSVCGVNAAIEKLPRHKFWGAGEPDCPPELKAPNGELHTMRCKVCGDGWRTSGNVCLAAHVVIHADLARRLIERLEYPGPSWAENRAGLAKELRVAAGVSASDGKTDRAALSAVPPTVKEPK